MIHTNAPFTALKAFLLEPKMSYFKLLTGRIERATRHSAAFDLFYSGDKRIWIGDQPILLPTGVTTEFSPDLVAIMKEKSGLSLKGLEVKAGVIDADYRGEWGVLVRNPIWVQDFEMDANGIPIIGTAHMILNQNWKPFPVDPGMKIAQFLLVNVPTIEFIGAGISQRDSIRDGGFGSTGR